MGPTFMGYPVTLSSAMPGSSAGANTVIALFGDFSRAGIFGLRRDFAIVASTDRFVEYDQTALFGTIRATGVWHDLGTANTAGPVVGLATGDAA